MAIAVMFLFILNLRDTLEAVSAITETNVARATCPVIILYPQQRPEQRCGHPCGRPQRCLGLCCDVRYHRTVGN